MSANTTIQWTDHSWNPIRGTAGHWTCSKISPGCDHCYASAMNQRFSKLAYPVVGATPVDAPRLDLKSIDQLRRWPAGKVFVCSMTDLFEERIPFDWITLLVGVMAGLPQHTFQVLTKRPGRAVAWFERSGLARLPANVWLGVSVEAQRYAWRIDEIRKIPASVYWVSAEPLLGPLDLSDWLDNISNLPPLPFDWSHPPVTPTGWYRINDFEPDIDWVVVGGESGPGCRPFNLDWARVLRDQCAAAEIPFFFKQRGGFPKDPDPTLDGCHHLACPDSAR